MLSKLKDIVLILFLISLMITSGIAINKAIKVEDDGNQNDYLYYLADALEESYQRGFFKDKIDFEDPVLNFRKIFLVTDFDEKQAEEIVAKLAYLDKKDPGVPIDLYIETSGGRGYGPVALFIQTMKSPVNTHALDWCNSAGTYLLASGTGKRYAFKSSRITIHTVGLDEEDDDIESETYKYNNQLLYAETEFWSNLTKVPKEIYEAKDDTYFYLTANEALDFGLIDEIIDFKRVNTTRGVNQGTNKAKK